MRNIALTIQYLGTNYKGWQSQADVSTVQDVLGEAVARTVGHKVGLCGSGRTDAGVHANGQVANFFTESSIPAASLPLALNIALPPDISVISAAEVDAEFNPRTSALSKTYVYRFYVSRVRLPLLDINHTQIYKMPDVEAMKECARYIVGYHDFKNFSSTGSAFFTTEREVYECAVSCFDYPFHGTNSVSVITVTIKGSAFLYNMARIIAGTLLACGKGLLETGAIKDIFTSGRPKCVKTAAARGHTLEKVEYAPRYGL